MPDRVRVASAMVQGVARRFADGGVDEAGALAEIREVLAPLPAQARHEALDLAAAVLSRIAGPGDEYVRPKAHALVLKAAAQSLAP